VPAQITQPSYSPLFRYPWAEACAALARMPEDSDGSRLLHYVNPFSGGPVMSLMDCYLLALPKSGATRRRWTSASTVAVAAEGAGESTVGEDKIAWSRNDVFTLPRKSWVSHQAASGGAKLFLTTDREVMRRLGLLEEKLD
jgi:gentisate 1,2-dioxygenase